MRDLVFGTKRVWEVGEFVWVQGAEGLEEEEREAPYMARILAVCGDKIEVRAVVGGWTESDLTPDLIAEATEFDASNARLNALEAILSWKSRDAQSVRELEAARGDPTMGEIRALSALAWKGKVHSGYMSCPQLMYEAGERVQLRRAVEPQPHGIDHPKLRAGDQGVVVRMITQEEEVSVTYPHRVRVLWDRVEQEILVFVPDLAPVGWVEPAVRQEEEDYAEAARYFYRTVVDTGQVSGGRRTIIEAPAVKRTEVVKLSGWRACLLSSYRGGVAIVGLDSLGAIRAFRLKSVVSNTPGRKCFGKEMGYSGSVRDGDFLHIALPEAEFWVHLGAIDGTYRRGLAEYNRQYPLSHVGWLSTGHVWGIK
jgi:hypothetical protein